MEWNEIRRHGKRRKKNQRQQWSNRKTISERARVRVAGEGRGNGVEGMDERECKITY